MKKWQYKMEGFKEIYENPDKIKLREYLNIFENKIDDILINKKLKLSLVGMSIHKLIYLIEKENISIEEIEQMTYLLAYFFLKDYIDLKKLIYISKLNEDDLKNKSEKTINLVKKDYKLIEKKELNINKIFEDMRKFTEYVNNN